MRGVITQVSRGDVVNAVNGVVAREEMRFRAFASVMDVRRVHRSKKRNQHRNDEHEDARQGPPKGQTRHERDDEERRQKQHTLMRWVPMTNLPRPRIRLKSVPNRILEPSHRAAIVVLPARFILGLIQVIHVMTQ